MKIIAVQCRGHELKAGDLFSTVGPEYWDRVVEHCSIGEKVYIRTGRPSTYASDKDSLVYRITFKSESAEGDVIDDDLLQEWVDAADTRIADLAQRLVGPGPKASHLSASEMHEVSDFVLDVALVALPRLIAEVRQSRAGRCVVGAACNQHGGAVHGREAEELRKGIEKILRDHESLSIEQNLRVKEPMRRAMIQLLDEVDARDSLAFLEKGNAPCVD